MRQRANETTVPLVAEIDLFVSDRGSVWYPPAASRRRVNKTPACLPVSTRAV